MWITPAQRPSICWLKQAVGFWERCCTSGLGLASPRHSLMCKGSLCAKQAEHQGRKAEALLRKLYLSKDMKRMKEWVSHLNTREKSDPSRENTRPQASGLEEALCMWRRCCRKWRGRRWGGETGGEVREGVGWPARPWTLPATHVKYGPVGRLQTPGGELHLTCSL